MSNNRTIPNTTIKVDLKECKKILFFYKAIADEYCRVDSAIYGTSGYVLPSPSWRQNLRRENSQAVLDLAKKCLELEFEEIKRDQTAKTLKP